MPLSIKFASATELERIQIPAVGENQLTTSPRAAPPALNATLKILRPSPKNPSV
ncbi:hypothetical protein D3C81_1817190 [compost metagenome]